MERTGRNHGMMPILLIFNGIVYFVAFWVININAALMSLLVYVVATTVITNVTNHFESIKQGYPIGWGKYCKSAIPATILVLVISTVMIIVRYC